VLRLLRIPYFRSERGRALLTRSLRALERGLPRNPELEAFVAAHQPDAVLITPLVDIGSRQLDHLRAAKALGMPHHPAGGSWDHLSSKALLRLMPDARAGVERGAEDRGGRDARRAGRSRARHRRAVLRPVVGAASRRGARGLLREGGAAWGPTVRALRVLVALPGTADEPAFVLDWIHALRSSPDPRLHDIGILVRPHPARLKEWSEVDLSGYRNVAFWGAHPVDAEAKDDYFDSMYYAAAVVGLNTSAFIEASVVGKPVHTVLLPEISTHNQEGTSTSTICRR
jgi:hypothetical protein